MEQHRPAPYLILSFSLHYSHCSRTLFHWAFRPLILKIKLPPRNPNAILISQWFCPLSFHVTWMSRPGSSVPTPVPRLQSSVRENILVTPINDTINTSHLTSVKTPPLPVNHPPRISFLSWPIFQESPVHVNSQLHSNFKLTAIFLKLWINTDIHSLAHSLSFSLSPLQSSPLKLRIPFFYYNLLRYLNTMATSHPHFLTHMLHDPHELNNSINI